MTPAKKEAAPGKGGKPKAAPRATRASAAKQKAPAKKAVRAKAKKAAPILAAPPSATPTPTPTPTVFPVPSSDGDAPLHELSRDALSAFLYAALLPEEALALVKRFGITFPGFRPEKASDVERCDALADEVRARPAARSPVLDVLRAGLKTPAFHTSSLDAVAADELLEVAGSDHGLAIALWRLVADPQPEVRARGAAALEKLAAEWYGPPPEGEGTQAAGAARPAKQAGSDPDGQKLKALEEKLARAEARAEQERQRGDQGREKLQAQLKEARAEAARAVAAAARARDAAERAGALQRQAEVALAQARATDAAAEAQRLRGALREAEVKLHAAEGEAARARERIAALEAALHSAAAAPAPAAAAAPAEGEEVEEAPATWLLPVFSDEFYRSLDGWDRRIQRAALKQAFLLSQDHRHPSLRALPLEGLPGYYRVRVATDVRLIYRRGERQDTVELCSLIDREDLDRYVRQAKTR